MTQKWVDRQIDEALLAIAMGAGFVWVRRRTRRLLSQITLGAAVIAGVGAVGIAGGAVAWRQKRSKRSAALAHASSSNGWRSMGAAAPTTAEAGWGSGGMPANDAESGSESPFGQ